MSMFTRIHLSSVYTIQSGFIVIRIVFSIKSPQLLYDANPCNHVLQVVPTISLVSTIMGQVYLCDQVHTSCTVYMVVFALVIHIESKSKCCVGVTQHQLKTKPLLST